MSSVQVREAAPLVAASAPRSSASAPENAAHYTAQCEVVFVAANKLQAPLATANTTCECVQQPKCIPESTPAQNGLGISMLPSAVSAVFVVIGWFVVNKAQGNRERRKQIRDFMGRLCDDLVELESLAMGYHTAEREETKEHEIISKLGRFEKDCANLPRFVQSQRFFKAVPAAKLIVDASRMQALRKSITLYHFGAEEHGAALDLHDSLIQELQLASEDIREALERIRIAALD